MENNLKYISYYGIGGVVASILNIEPIEAVLICVLGILFTIVTNILIPEPKKDKQ